MATHMSESLPPTTQRVRIELVGYTRRTRDYFLEVPADATPEQLEQLKYDLQQKADGGEYVDDPDYWENGETTLEAAPQGVATEGFCTLINGALVPTFVPVEDIEPASDAPRG